MALNSQLCADVPLSNYSLTHSLSYLLTWHHVLLYHNCVVCKYASHNDGGAAYQ